MVILSKKTFRFSRKIITYILLLDTVYNREWNGSAAISAVSMRRQKARVYTENTSDAWHIPRYPTRKHCITSIYYILKPRYDLFSDAALIRQRRLLSFSGYKSCAYSGSGPQSGSGANSVIYGSSEFSLV